MPYPRGTSKEAIVEAMMHKFKHHKLKSGGKKPVTDRKQAIAIALSEGRKYAK